MDYVTIFWKTILFYIIIMIVYRVMGKREVGELSVMDLTVSMFMANIVAIGIEKFEDNVFFTIVPIVLLAVLQVILAKISLHCVGFRNTVEGEPSVIINRGKVNFDEMLRQRYNLDDLLVELRGQGIKSIEDVDYAILEVSGKLSVFEKNNDCEYPLPVILDGKIDEDTLRQIGKSKEWLLKSVKKEGYSVEDVYYGFFRQNEVFLIKRQNM